MQLMFQVFYFAGLCSKTLFETSPNSKFLVRFSTTNKTNLADLANTYICLGCKGTITSLGLNATEVESWDWIVAFEQPKESRNWSYKHKVETTVNCKLILKPLK